MPFRLRDDLHWCNCGGRAVFLDVLADRYFCLPQSANEAFLRLADEKAGPGDVERLQMLIERGMLVEAGAPASIEPPPSIEAPTGDLIERPYRRAPMSRILRALASELRWSRALRTSPFHALIEDARRRSLELGPKASGPGRSLAEIAAAAAAASFITRSHDRCLVRALAVHSLCSGSGAKLVFGVIAHPFTAHCWVQLGSNVIVGGYEQARLYTPILVVG